MTIQAGQSLLHYRLVDIVTVVEEKDGEATVSVDGERVPVVTSEDGYAVAYLGPKADLLEADFAEPLALGLDGSEDVGAAVGAVVVGRGFVFARSA